METGKFDLARDALEQAIVIYPKMVAAYNNLGYLDLLLFVKTRDEKYREDAIAEFDKALVLGPAARVRAQGQGNRPPPPIIIGNNRGTWHSLPDFAGVFCQ